MKIIKENIKNYIPQREPFIMVDNILDANAEKFQTDFTIFSDNIFLEGDKLSECALIENIAQSCAAGLFLINMEKASKPLDGFIGGISKLFVFDLPKVGDTINTDVYFLHQFANMYLMKGEVYLNKKKLLECELKLAGL